MQRVSDLILAMTHRLAGPDYPVLVACGESHVEVVRVDVGMAPNSGIGGLCLLIDAELPDSAEQLQEIEEEIEDCRVQNDELRCALEEILEAAEALRRGTEISSTEHVDIEDLKRKLECAYDKARGVL